jgi:hypothetical protein
MEGNDRKARAPVWLDGCFRRVSSRVCELSLLAKAIAVVVASMVAVLTMAFGSGRVRVSTEGVELQPKDAVGAVSDHSIASPSVHGSLYLILAPHTVRFCGP